MRVSVCVGEYAKIPYWVPGLERNVYCVEELCYCIKEGAFLLDLSFLDDGLLDWLERECGLKELAKALHPLVHKQGSLSSFAAAILQYAGFYDWSTVREIEKVLKQAAGLSAIEKRKTQIDYMAAKKKYEAALKGYDTLLQKWQEQEAKGEMMPTVSTLAAIWHNKGTSFAGLMRYDEAAECFLRAYELGGGADSGAAYLAAMRLKLSEKGYEDLTAAHGNMVRERELLEKKWELLTGEWEQQPDYLRLNYRGRLREKDMQKYMEETEQMVQALKDDYRSTAY